MAVTGTLSILFSDLRDYTAFVEKYGDAAGAALITEYRRLVRAEVARAGGGEMNTAGDSFYIVFPTARQALQAGMGILREAERHSREHPDRPLRIGIGAHAGEPVPHEGQHVGSAVNIAARLAQQAAAGELLVSEIVRGLLRTSGAPPMRELEGLVLKGVQDPPRVYVVVRPEPKAEARATPVSTEVAIPAEPPAADQRMLCPELVGRERELHRLEALLQETLAGRGRTILLAGGAGIGKSAMLRAFAQQAVPAGAQVLVGECVEIEARRPFGPFLDLAAVARGQSASSTDAAELLGLPDGRGGLSLVESPSEGERYQIHAAFARFFGELAQRAALVLVVEDLHWADEATLELFPYLARKLRERPALLVGSYRSDELHRRHPLTHLLAELSRGRLATELNLDPLSLEHTGTMIRATLGLSRPPTTEFRTALHERCGGNPFFIEEVLRVLVERGDLSYRDGAWRRTKDVFALAIPVTVRDAVQQRMRALSPDARRATQVAAVIGQRFDFDLLQRVTGLSEAALLEALRAAVEAQLINEEQAPNEDERYVFRHALTRESVLAELLQRERRLLHRAVGEAIEAVVGATTAHRAEELAYHFDQARDSERALRYHELAAREATRMFAFARSVEHLERAVELAADDDPSLGELQLRLADAAHKATDIPRALRAGEEALRIFESAGDAHRSGSALRQLSSDRWMLGETQEANKLAAEAVQLLEPLGESAELAAAQAEVARLAMVDERTAEAIEWGRRAIEMARRTNALEALVLALIVVGGAMSRTDAGGLVLLRESLDLALKHEFVWYAQRAYNNLCVAMSFVGAPKAEIRRIHEEGVQHAHRYGLLIDSLISQLCYFAFTDGDWDEALDYVEEGRGDTVFSAPRELIEAYIETARHGPEQALRLVETPRRRLLAAGDAQWVAAAAASAHVMLLAGELRATLDHAECATDLIARDHPAASLAAVCAIEASRALRDESALDRWIELGIARRKELHPHGLRGRDAFARAELAAKGGDRDAAVAMLGESTQHFLQDSDAAAHWSRLRRAELFLERNAPGDREAAQAELDAVLPYWRKAKATWYLGKLKEWATQHGLRFPDG